MYLTGKITLRGRVSEYCVWATYHFDSSKHQRRTSSPTSRLHLPSSSSDAPAIIHPAAIKASSMRFIVDARFAFLLIATLGGVPSSCDAWLVAQPHQNAPLSRKRRTVLVLTTPSAKRLTLKLARRVLRLYDRKLDAVEECDDVLGLHLEDRIRGSGRKVKKSSTSGCTAGKRATKKRGRIRLEPPTASSHPSERRRRRSVPSSAVSDGITTSATHQFNRELQHLVRNGKVIDGRTVAEQAEELLLKRVVDMDATDASYDTVSFNIVLQAWANQRSMTAAQRADDLLRLMLRTKSPTHANATRTNLVQADAYSYAAVLNGYAKSGGKIKAARRATELLAQFERSSLAAVTSDVCHNAAMNAWAVSGSPQAGERAEQILRQLMGIKTVQPTRIAFNACIKAYAKAGQPAEAQRLLDQMKALSVSQPNLAPDKITYSSCIDAWSRSCDSSDAANQAERLLGEMEDAFASTGDVSVQPDVVSYTSVLSAFAQSGSIHPHKAQQLLERMRVHAQEEPNAPFLNAWIHLLARTAAGDGATDATARQAAAEVILEYMQTEFAKGNKDMKPCKITYTAVISVVAHVGTLASARRAEELLDELQTMWERTNDRDYLPSAKTFASVLNAWAKTGSPMAVEAAEKLVGRMEQLHERTGVDELAPSLVVFVQVFQVLANSKSSTAAEKAKQLLQRMHQLHLMGFPEVRPDATTYAYLINTFTKAKVGNVAELATIVLMEAEEGYRAGIGSLKPTALLYSAVLQAYAKSSSRRGAELAEELLERTKELYRQGKLYAKPTTLFYNAVIDAHARSGGGRDSAERAEALLEELERRALAGDATLCPTTRTYNAAILAWKNVGVGGGDNSDAPVRAEALLRRMNDAHKAGRAECRPDRVTLNSIIGVWANSDRAETSGAGERAEQFLTFMERSAQRGDHSLAPDAFTYNSCIAAYARRNQLRAALRVYERMKSRHGSVGNDVDCRPDAITAVLLRRALSSCREEISPGEALRLEHEISRYYCSSGPEEGVPAVAATTGGDVPPGSPLE